MTWQGSADGGGGRYRVFAPPPADALGTGVDTVMGNPNRRQQAGIPATGASRTHPLHFCPALGIPAGVDGASRTRPLLFCPADRAVKAARKARAHAIGLGQQGATSIVGFAAGIRRMNRARRKESRKQTSKCHEAL